MRGLSSHRIFIRFVCGNVRSTFFRQESDIDLRVIGHHALIHAIEGQTHTVRTPESALVDAKLIAVDRLSVDNLA